MARVRCVMMQRDEDLLLDAWCRYYGYLFGFENLTIFDNGSVNERVIYTLKTYEHAGVDVRWEHTRVEDFHAKGQHFKHVITHWDNIGGYDFALPLDCDEFLTVMTPGGLDCRRRAIHDALDACVGEERPLGFDWSLYNAIGIPGAFSAVRYPKRFIAAGTVGEIDHGFHAITSAKQDGLRQVPFTYLHFHNKPYAMLREHARRKLELFTDVNDLSSLRDYKGPGLHLVQYFFMTEEQYRRSYDDRMLLMSPMLINHFRALGIVDDFIGSSRPAPAVDRPDRMLVLFPAAAPGAARSIGVFDAESYYRANPDVALSGSEALGHYIAFGFAEGRPLHPVPTQEARAEAAFGASPQIVG